LPLLHVYDIIPMLTAVLQFHCFTDVSRTITFPDRRFPDKTFLGQDLSRTVTFPDRRFPDKLY